MPSPVVYALRPCTTHGQQRVIDEVFALTLYEEVLLHGGYVELLPSGTALYKHMPTGRIFVKREAPGDVWRIVSGITLRSGYPLTPGERITPTHPDFPLLSWDYRDSPHPIMIPEYVYEALAPSAAPEKPSPEAPTNPQEPAQEVTAPALSIPEPASSASPKAPERMKGKPGRKPGSGKIYPNRDRFMELLERIVDDFRYVNQKDPSLPQVRDRPEWPSDRPSERTIRERVEEFTEMTWTEWLANRPWPLQRPV